MARHEADREDLFAETRGVVPRIEFPCGGETALVGRKREGGLVVYLGQDRMYGFRPEGGLRRALADGLLFKAAPGRKLVRMRRDRSGGGHVLRESELTEPEVAGFLADAAQRLSAALHDLERADLSLCRVDPPSRPESVPSELSGALRQLLAAPLEVADGL